MASLMENLEEILDRESMEYETLLGLSMRKTSVIVKGDVAELKKITEEEQLAVSRITHIEHERDRVMSDVAGILNMDVTKLKLRDLLQVLERRPEERQKLAIVFDRLSRQVKTMKQVNEQNRNLIENALDMTRFELNMIQAMKSAPETANYDKAALSDGSAIATTQARFDARQ